MRIISGTKKNRIIKMVGIETTRETSDMVRESIFNLTSHYEKKGIALDLFAGSGAMGLEALSRGVDKCYFSDINQIAYNTVKENLKNLELTDNSVVFKDDYLNVLNNIKDVKFDFIFLDPPYHLDCINDIINFILTNNMLSDDALIICETNKEYKYEDFEGLEVYKEKKYGIKKVVIFR